jgi:RNA polymerase sigma-70 factor (ECF subfamily)
MAHTHDENCKEVFALLTGYLDLELPADTCAEVEAHLADCPPCIEFAESLRKTVELCRRYQPAELPTPLGDQARTELMAAYRKMLDGRKSG